MSIVNNPHDKFFKETLGNVSVTQDFIKSYLPKNILDIIDIDTLTPLKDSFIKQNLEEFFSDLLFEVKINGLDGYLYFLFEHKSYQAKNISFQLLKYMIEIWESKLNKEKTDELPLVIPLVIYHGREKWRIAKTLGNLIVGYNDLPEDIQKYIPNYEYLLYDLSEFSDEDIKGEAQLRVFLNILKHIFVKDIEQLILYITRAAEILAELEDTRTGVEYFKTYIIYVLSVRDDLSIEKLNEKLPNEGRQTLMSVADQLRKEGKIKGMKEGIEEGRKEGIERGRKEGIERGRKEGIERAKKDAAKKMLQLNIDVEQIKVVTGLSKDDIIQIKKNLNE